METDESKWRTDLREDLTKIVEHYTPDRYPATIETQREYDQGLHLLAERYSDRLDNITEGKREQYDKDFRQSQLDRLNDAEQRGLERVRTPKDQLSIRAGQKGDRDALEDGSHRDREDYKAGMNQIGEEHIQRQEQADRAFDQISKGLDDRFGFSRDQDRDREDRER